MSYQKIIIVGRVGNEPEMRYTPDGTAVTNFSLAVNKSNKNGSKTTTWFKVTAWRKQAEATAEYLKKGRQVMVEGDLAADMDTGGPRVWTARDGTPRASFEVTAQRIIFLGNKNEQTEQTTVARPVHTSSAQSVSEDDLPF